MLSEEVGHFTVDDAVQSSDFQFLHNETVHHLLLFHGAQENLSLPPSVIQLILETHCTKGC